MLLKAFVVWAGGEVAKTHDPSAAFREAVGRLGLPIPPETVDRIARASTDLARLRAPAFYAEIRISEAQARAARTEAEAAWVVLAPIVEGSRT